MKVGKYKMRMYAMWHVPHRIFDPLHRCHTKGPSTVTACTALRKQHCMRRYQNTSDTCIFERCFLGGLATFSKVVACCGREMHSVLDPSCFYTCLALTSCHFNTSIPLPVDCWLVVLL